MSGEKPRTYRALRPIPRESKVEPVAPPVAVDLTTKGVEVLPFDFLDSAMKRLVDAVNSPTVESVRALEADHAMIAKMQTLAPKAEKYEKVINGNRAGRPRSDAIHARRDRIYDAIMKAKAAKPPWSNPRIVRHLLVEFGQEYEESDALKPLRKTTLEGYVSNPMKLKGKPNKSR